MQSNLEMSVIDNKQLITSKKEIESRAYQTVTNILEREDLVDIIVKITSMEKLLEAIKKDGRFRDAVIEEVLQVKEGVVKQGAKVEVSEVGVKYDYSQCGDVEWGARLSELELAKEALKEREAFLKSIKGHLDIIDKETGEVATLYPPSKTSTTSPKITLAK